MALRLQEEGWTVKQDGWKARRLGAPNALSRLQNVGGVGHEGLKGSLDDYWRKLGGWFKDFKGLSKGHHKRWPGGGLSEALMRKLQIR